MSLKEIRKYKIKINDELNVAAFDTIGTLLIGLIISKKTGYSPVVVVPGLFVAAELVHAGFGIDTPGLIFINENFK
jgi:hypothetical protein